MLRKKYMMLGLMFVSVAVYGQKQNVTICAVEISYIKTALL